VAGPCTLSTPAGVARVDVRSASEMRGAVLGAIAAQQIFVSAAAVADFRPRRIARGKIKKGAPELTLELEATEDILAEVASARDRPFVVGFAAESERLREHARQKLEGKHLDLIFANDIGIPGQGFDAERNQLLALWPGGERELPLGGKRALAELAVALIAERYRARAAETAR